MVVADGIGEEIYDKALSDAFILLGHDVRRFTWRNYFHNYQYKSVFNAEKNTNIKDKVKSLYYRIQNKFIFGPVVDEINYELVKSASEYNPDFIFIYRGTHIYSSTIDKIKQNNKCKIYGYNNDDPFSLTYPKFFWRHFNRCINTYDHIFCYRHKNISDYHKIGYEKVSLLRSYYLKDKNFPIDIKSKYDVIFIGHFENDSRDEYIKILIDNNINVKLYGSHWEKSKYYNFFRKKLGEDIVPIFGDEYNKKLNSSKIALVFYSKLNNDTYTRRCFEIPATRKLMFAEYTADMDKNLFKMGVEADYFRDAEEFITKIKCYLSDEKLYETVRNSGYNRLLLDGHEVVDRAKHIVKVHEDEVNN